MALKGTCRLCWISMHALLLFFPSTVCCHLKWVLKAMSFILFFLIFVTVKDVGLVQDKTLIKSTFNKPHVTTESHQWKLTADLIPNTP